MSYFDEDVFLRLVENNSVVFDKQNRHYRDSVAVQNAWEEIARSSGLRDGKFNVLFKYFMSMMIKIHVKNIFLYCYVRFVTSTE